ncbi:MAG: class I SAM-dependent rRNA methyltransferase [Gammaproteobacteria bacterium]|nr:class I SAM-dependent rRNA methyltransferase [Pseudomonadales bacterium]MCP5348160.1 class I SAM-dependent rRNA methyltransferase [Pseudomonadales bacterium]
MKTVRLKKGREASLQRRHPWVFSGAIETVEGNPQAGDVVRVVGSDRTLLGVGAWSPESQIRVRLLRFEDGAIDRDFLQVTLAAALAKRNSYLQDTDNNACRLVFGESDHLPGLIVDRYDDFLVCQFQFAGLEPWKTTLVELLAEQTGCRGILERSDTAARKREGLTGSEGTLWGDPAPEGVLIRENGLQFEVNITSGQKTGFYLDQAENRHLVRSYCRGRTVLNCFAYTGGFSLAALSAGATHVTSVDSSAPALTLLERNLQHNQLHDSRHQAIEARVGNLLRDWQAEGRRIDLVVLDPPKFAEQKSQVMKAARAYKDLALQAVKLINPGGYLVTFSCSGGIDLKLFQKITADAFLDADRDGEIVRYLHQGFDHPVALAFPESQYLKGLICRVND